MDLSIKEYDPVESVQADIWAMIGLPARGAELHKLVHQGLPFVFYQRLAVILDVPESELRQYLCISPATISRRAAAAAAARLNTTESNRLCSLVGLDGVPQQSFGVVSIVIKNNHFESEGIGRRPWN